MKKDAPKYTQVEDYIKQAIKNKQFASKLPGERTLANQLGFSYMTVRKAIDNLVAEGILYKIPTKGSFINNKAKKNTTRTIGYFLDSSIQAGISSPYYSMIFNAIEKEAAKHKYSVVYFSDADQGRLRSIFPKLDGVIATCFPRVEDTILDINLSVPVVAIDNSTPDQTIPSVVIDNFSANVESVNYACSLGHDRIGFMTGLDDSDVGKNRYAGYLHGLEHNQIEADNTLVYRGNYSYEAGIDGAAYFLSLPRLPQTIICANDSMALGAIQRLNQEGFSVPDDISIIGFDNIEVAPQVVPALTTNAAPVDEIAKHAFAMLKSLINGTQPAYQHVALTAPLIIRDSCATLQTSPKILPKTPA